MKKALFSLALLMSVLYLFGQGDQPTYGYHYQAIIRNGSTPNSPVAANQPVVLRFQIFNAANQKLYEETHTAATDNFGRASAVIGAGTPVTGTFGALNWAAGKHFLQVRVKVGAGSEADLGGKEEIIHQPLAKGSGDWLVNGQDIYRIDGGVGVGTADPTAKLTVKGDFSIMANDPAISGGKVLQIDLTPSFAPQTGAQGFRMIAAYPHGGGWNSGPRIDVLGYNGNTWLATDVNGNGLGKVGVGTRLPNSRMTLAGDFSIMNPADPAASGGKVLHIDLMPSFAPQTGAMGFRMTAAYPHSSGWNNGPLIDVLGYDGNTWLATDVNGNDLGKVGIGTRFPQAKLDVNGDARVKSLTILGNDRAHLLNTTNGKAIPPHTVAVFDEMCHGKIRPSTDAYDRKVAGVISDISQTATHRTGIIHAQENTANGSPVAVDGTVVVLATGPIAVGDYLTTSNVPGHAMKAKNKRKSYGAILGKAMTPLAKGEKGKVEMWVERH